MQLSVVAEFFLKTIVQGHNKRREKSDTTNKSQCTSPKVCFSVSAIKNLNCSDYLHLKLICEKCLSWRNIKVIKMVHVTKVVSWWCNYLYQTNINNRVNSIVRQQKRVLTSHTLRIWLMLLKMQAKGAMGTMYTNLYRKIIMGNMGQW